MQIIFDSLDELESFVVRFQTPGAVSAPVLSSLSGKRGPKLSLPSLSATTSEAPKRRVSKDGESLTVKVRKVITNFINKGDSFSANAVYQVLAKKDPDTKKESVIASVLKLMTSEFVHVPFKFEKGKGPRDVKMYHPVKTA
jgi:hypothetical protein